MYKQKYSNVWKEEHSLPVWDVLDKKTNPENEGHVALSQLDSWEKSWRWLKTRMRTIFLLLYLNRLLATLPPTGKEFLCSEQATLNKAASNYESAKDLEYFTLKISVKFSLHHCSGECASPH